MGVIGKGECVNSSRVALQIKSSRHFPEFSSLSEADLPHLDVRSEAAWRNKPGHRQEISKMPIFLSLYCWMLSYVEIAAPRAANLWGWQTDLPHGEMAAYELVIWLVLIEARTSPFRSQIWMLVSVEALMINLPLERKRMDIKLLSSTLLQSPCISHPTKTDTVMTY